MDGIVKQNYGEKYKMGGLDLILTSINCKKYKSTFEKYGINEHTMLNLTANDLRYMEVDDNDITKIMTAVNVLNKTINLSEIQLSNDEILKLQSTICGQLGSLALILNLIYSKMSNNINFNDTLIDDYLSSTDACMMLKPYLKAEEKNIETKLKQVHKIKQKRRTILITTTVSTALLFGLALHRSNYSFNTVSTFINLMSKMRSWHM